MKRDPSCFVPKTLIPRFRSLPCPWWLAGLLVVASGSLGAQGAGEKVVVRSAGAVPVQQVVRVRSAGVITNLSVCVGQAVKKGQVLGHTYLDDTKYRLDLARLAWKSNASLRALEAHADAWSVNREETREKVRKREATDLRLDWAVHMERFHRSNYEAKLEQQEVDRLNVLYWEKKYEDCFITAPVDGVITLLNKGIGDTVGVAAPVCTIRNDDSFVIPVPVTSDLAERVSVGANLPLRTADSKQVTQGRVERIETDPGNPSGRIIRVVLGAEQVASAMLTAVSGQTFDVLLSQPQSKYQDERQSM